MESHRLEVFSPIELWRRKQRTASFAMIGYVLVFLGAGIGGMARHTVNIFAARYLGLNFPWGTFLINVSGSFLMGALAGYLAFKTHLASTGPLRLFAAAGILGGYTTFSSFSLDSVLLWENGAGLNALLYVIFSVLLGILALVAGLTLMRAIS